MYKYIYIFFPITKQTKIKFLIVFFAYRCYRGNFSYVQKEFARGMKKKKTD